MTREQGARGDRAKRKPGRPVRRPREAHTSDKILEAAVDLFSRQGFDATPVRRIAAEAGITEGAVYRHFSGKDEILDRILAYAEERIFSPFPFETMENADGCSLFGSLLAPLPEAIAADPYLVKISRIVYMEMLRNGRIREYLKKRYIERGDEFTEQLFSQAMERGAIRSCDPRALARVFNAFRTEWAFQTYILAGEEPVDPDQARASLEPVIRFFDQFLGPAGDARPVPDETTR